VILASAAWLAIVFGEPGDQPRVTVLESFGFDDSFDDNQDVAADPHLAKLPGRCRKHGIARRCTSFCKCSVFLSRNFVSASACGQRQALADTKFRAVQRDAPCPHPV